jgi:hypothetical protein
LATQNLVMSVKKLTAGIIATKTTIGNYDSDPNSYSEEFDVSSIGVYTLISVNVNGLNYVVNKSSSYNQGTGKLKLYGVKTTPNDTVCVVYNKISLDGTLQKAKSVPVTISGNDAVIKGDFATDPINYSETYNVASLGIQSLIGVDVNSVLYCDPDSVIYNGETKELTVKGMQLKPDYDICIIFNTEN